MDGIDNYFVPVVHAFLFMTSTNVGTCKIKSYCKNLIGCKKHCFNSFSHEKQAKAFPGWSQVDAEKFSLL